MTSDAHVRGTPAEAATPGDGPDAVLLARLRAGDDSAMAELFAAHAPAVRRFACGIAADRSQAEDIAAETFFRVLQAVRRGYGPRDHVRAYLLTVARRVAGEWRGAARDVPVSDDELDSRAGAQPCRSASAADHALIARAFSSLPERWRTVLWQTEVEGDQPAAVAPRFGLSANAAAALARRARQGLRAAYLQAHLASTAGGADCRSVLAKLGSYTAGTVTGPERRRIAAHLDTCGACRVTHDELRDVCFSLRAHAGVVGLVAPLAVGAGSGAGGSGGLAALANGVKAKVAAAVVSTAMVGVLGLAGGGLLTEVSSVGLSGRQGVPELTVERPSGGGSTAPRQEPDRAAQQRLAQPADLPAAAEATGSPETPAAAGAADPEVAAEPAGTDRTAMDRADEPSGADTDATEVTDTARQKSSSAPSPEPGPEPGAEPDSGASADLPASSEPAEPSADGSAAAPAAEEPAAEGPTEAAPAAEQPIAEGAPAAEEPASPPAADPAPRKSEPASEWVLVEESTWCDEHGSYTTRRYERTTPDGAVWVRDEWVYSSEGAC